MTLFLCGDVMLGRGVDQILPHPTPPALREPYVRDARGYVALAEEANGPVPRPAAWDWPWGDSLSALDEARPDVRVINLETSVTLSDDYAPDKSIHYRMSPANLPALAAVRPDVCVLANNHVLDFGRTGLLETLDTLSGAGLRTAGAGRDASGARRPAAVPLPTGARVLVHAFGMSSSGIPTDWAAIDGRSGVDLVEPTPAAADDVIGRVQQVKRPGDLTVVSIHWGTNWGYHVPREFVRFAHALVDGGADVVHGHSSHHPRPLELYRGHPILYGCGDLVDDYEGITGYENYRDDLRLLYLVRLDPATGEATGVRMVPLQAHRMRLRHASAADTAWLCGVLDRACRSFGTRIGAGPDGVLLVRDSRDQADPG